MIIGITGPYCAGKDMAANYFLDKGFLHISLSDLIRNQMKKTKIAITRSNLIKYANSLRKKFGPSVLARVAINSMLPNRNYIVSSIRNFFELEVLKSRKDFISILIEAPVKTRFERLLKRTDRKEDKKIKTFEEFKNSEQTEKSNDLEKQQLHLVFNNADIIIKNDSSLKVLDKKLDKFFKKYKPKLDKRPGWDDYFIHIMHALAARGTCDRGKSGALIVKNKRILSTGYVGSPAGLAHCDDIGHQFIKRINENETISLHCIRTTHAEANAIVQAARHGISVEGATLYCQMAPCYDCAKMIINAGIKRVVAERDYQASANSKKIFAKAGVKLDIKIKEVTPYAKQKA